MKKIIEDDYVKKPLVSVVVPCLNRANFLVPTIESILQQDYPNIECIIIDGASTDDTIKILRSYGSRISWVSEPDKGQADAINRGWKRSQGEILTWLNADDVWVTPNAVSQAITYFKNHPQVGVVYGDCGKIDEYGNVIGMSYLHEWSLTYAVEYCDHCIAQPASFIRRHILQRVGWLDATYYHKMDHDLWLRIGLVNTIRHVPILLAYARKHPDNKEHESVRLARSCVQLTKKFFTLSNVPESLRRRQRRAISNAYLRGATYTLVKGRHWKTFIWYVLRAIVSDPLNILTPLIFLKNYLRKNHRKNYYDK